MVLRPTHRLGHQFLQTCPTWSHNLLLLSRPRALQRVSRMTHSALLTGILPLGLIRLQLSLQNASGDLPKARPVFPGFNLPTRPEPSRQSLNSCLSRKALYDLAFPVISGLQVVPGIT